MNAEGLHFGPAPNQPWHSGTLSRRDAALRAARRNSARVRKLRILIPGLLVMVFAAIAAGKMLPTLPIDSRVSIGRISFEDGKLTMENARLTGFRQDSRSYELVAAKAIQDPKDASVVHLRSIDGKMTQTGGKWTRLTADEGTYYSEQEKADLRRNIVVTSENGQVVRLEQARIDLKSGDMSTDVPVRIEMLNGTLDAQSMTIRERGEVMYFKDQVRLVFVPKKDEEQSAKP